MDTRLTLRNVSKVYASGGMRTRVLRGVGLEVARGEVLWLSGASGSGKSTLINVAGLLTRPSAGEVHIDGRDLTNAPDARATAARAGTIGMVFQSHNLLPQLSAHENVLIAASPGSARDAQALLDRVGLGRLRNARANTLSGGQQQRVAVARALVNSPVLLLADEPTSGLDLANAEVVLSVMEEAAQGGCGVVISSHDQGVARIAHRRVELELGAIK